MTPVISNDRPDRALRRPPFAWDRFAHEHDAEATRIDREYFALMHADLVGNVTVARTVSEVLEATALFKAELDAWRRRKAEDVLERIGGHRD